MIKRTSRPGAPSSQKQGVAVSKKVIAASCLGLMLTTTALAGCAPQVLPSVPPLGYIAPTPVLTQDQTYNVLGHVAATLANATANRDPNVLPARVTGPALAVRTSQLEVAAIRDNNDQVTVIPDTYQQLIVPIGDQWPRTLFAITAVTDELQPPRLLALEQAMPRDPYRLWGWVQLMPGVTMPAFADPRVGSEEVHPDDATSLVMSPQEAIRQYADLLVNGDASPYNANFQPMAEDEFRFHIAGWSAAQAAALQGERIEGTYLIEATPVDSPPAKAVRSADGGAMVMGEIHTFERLEAMEGAVLAPQTVTAQALLYGQEFTNILTASYIDMIALYIPPAGSDQVVTFLGYSHIQTGATVSDPVYPEEPAEEGGEEAATE